MAYMFGGGPGEVRCRGGVNQSGVEVGSQRGKGGGAWL